MGRQGASRESNDREAERDRREDEWVHRLHAVDLAFQERTKSGGAGKPQNQSTQDQYDPFTNNKFEDVCSTAA